MHIKIGHLLIYILYVHIYKSLMDLCNSCNMGMRDLPDMYARSPRGSGIHAARGLRTYISGKSRMAMLQLLCINLFS